MRSLLCLAIALLAFQSADSVSAGERQLRETGITGEERALVRDDPDQGDETILQSWHSPANPPYFMTIPNEFGDNYYNVRFTPPFEPFYIIGVYLTLFDMDSIQGGPAGTPGVKITVFESGAQDDSSGFPADSIASLEFPNISEDGDTLKLCRANNLYWNFLDLRPLGINFQDRVDFHIAISSISDAESDTIAIFHDDGRMPYRSDRSGLWDGQDSVWVKMKYLQGIRLGLNFFVQCLISDRLGGDEVGVFDLPPNMFRLSPAFPNPFNHRTSLQFSIPDRNPYNVQLFDRQGRLVKLLGEGTGGTGVLALDAGSLASGTYFVILSTPSGVVSQPIHLIR